ncbi:MAG TPA: GAF domain-containing protein [Clostridiales bacterium]|nr:GAF domain-containing protein [Clostridiales bacterium]HQP70715.1 GAF domain-containing protein [Clostridiales bacterium]
MKNKESKDQNDPVSSSDSDIFSISSEESFFNSIADIESLRSFIPTHEETESKKLQQVLGVTEKLMTTYDKGQIFHIIIEKSIEFTGAERGYLILVKPDNELEIAYSLNMDSQKPDESMREISSTVINKVLNDKEVIIVKDALNDQEYEVKRSIINLRLKSIMCVPMIKENKVSGIIYVENRKIPGIFNSESGEVLKFFGNQCAIALENLDLIEENRQYALTLEKQVEQRTSELQYEKAYTERIIENIGEILITVGKDSKIIKANKALNEILGLDPDHYIGLEIKELYSRNSHLYLCDAIDSKRNTANISCYIKDHENNDKHFSATISHIFENDEIIGSVIINKDMTEVEKYEQEKLEKKELESITKAAVTANDQINTPLGVIIGRAAILNSLIPDDENISKNLQVIKEQAFRIKDTLNEMKEITKISEKDYKIDGVKMIDLDKK